MQCIGAPKSGNHLLVHAVQLLGIADVVMSHDPKDRGDKTIMIYRNPRNVMVSWVRFTAPRYAQGYLMGAIRKTYADDLSGYFRSFSLLLNDPGILSVKFEDLINHSQRELEKMANHLGVEVLDDASESLIVQTVTASPGLSKNNQSVLSDWKQPQWKWSNKIEREWLAAGGAEIERAFGYAV